MFSTLKTETLRQTKLRPWGASSIQRPAVGASSAVMKKVVRINGDGSLRVCLDGGDSGVTTRVSCHPATCTYITSGQCCLDTTVSSRPQCPAGSAVEPCLHAYPHCPLCKCQTVPAGWHQTGYSSIPNGHACNTSVMVSSSSSLDRFQVGCGLLGMFLRESLHEIVLSG